MLSSLFQIMVYNFTKAVIRWSPKFTYNNQKYTKSNQYIYYDFSNFSHTREKYIIVCSKYAVKKITRQQNDSVQKLCYEFTSENFYISYVECLNIELKFLDCVNRSNLQRRFFYICLKLLKRHLTWYNFNGYL